MPHILFLLFDWTLPTRNCYLLDAAKCQLSCRRIPGYGRSGGHGSIFTDCHRRHQLTIGTDKGSVADYGFIFIDAIVVAGNRAGANIHVAADLAIADIT